MAVPQARDLGAAAPPAQVVLELARFLDAKRASAVRVLEVEKILQICSYFVLATGTSSRHLQTLADGAQKILKSAQVPRIGIAGYVEGHWICLDYVDLVVHLFDGEAREFYDLDHLYGDAPVIPWADAPP